MMKMQPTQNDVTKQGKKLELINCKSSTLPNILNNCRQDKIYLIRVTQIIGSYWYMWAVDGDNKCVQETISELYEKFKENTDFFQFYNWLKDFDSVDVVKNHPDFENQRLKLNEALKIIKYNKLRDDYSMQVASKNTDDESIKLENLMNFAKEISNDTLSDEEFNKRLEKLKKEFPNFLEKNLSLDAFGQEGTGNLIHAQILALGKEYVDRLNKLLEIDSVRYIRVPAKFGNTGTSYPLRLALEQERHGYAKTVVNLDPSLVNDPYIVSKAQNQDKEEWTKASSASFQDHGCMLYGFVQRLYNSNFSQENINLKAIETVILAIHFLIQNNANLDPQASLSTIQYQWLYTNAPQKPEWLKKPLTELNEIQINQLKEAEQNYSIPVICMLFEKVIESRDIKKQFKENIPNWIIELIEKTLTKKHDLIDKTYPTNHAKWPRKTMLDVAIEKQHVRLLGTLLRYSNWDSVRYKVTNCLSSITEAKPIDREDRKIAIQELLLKVYSNNELLPKIPQTIEQFRDGNKDLDNMLNAMVALHSVFESGSTKIEEWVQLLANDNRVSTSDIYELISNTKRTRSYFGFGGYKPNEGVTQENPVVLDLRQKCSKNLDIIFNLLEGIIKQNLDSAILEYPDLLREMTRSYFSRCNQTLSTGQRIIIEEVNKYLDVDRQIDTDTLNPSPFSPLPSQEIASKSTALNVLSTTTFSQLGLPEIQPQPVFAPPPLPQRNPTPPSTEGVQQPEEPDTQPLAPTSDDSGASQTAVPPPPPPIPTSYIISTSTLTMQKEQTPPPQRLSSLLEQIRTRRDDPMQGLKCVQKTENPKRKSGDPFQSAIGVAMDKRRKSLKSTEKESDNKGDENSPSPGSSF
jgi:hypothetical protein